MKASLNTIAVILFLICAPIAHQAQTITCSSLCVTQIANDSINNGIAVSISISDSGFINYPFIHQILDQSNNVIGTGSVFFFGQFGNTTQIYPATSTNTNWNNFVGTIVFVFDSDTCYLPYPCTLSGVTENETAESFRVSPNPAANEFMISNEQGFKNASIEIFTADGKSVMFMNSLSGNNIRIPSESLPAGCYIVRIADEGREMRSERLMITK